MTTSKAKFTDYLLLLPGIGFIVFFIFILVMYTMAQSVGLFTISGDTHFTLAYWEKFMDRRFFDSLFYSLKVGLISSVLALCIAYPLSMMLQITYARNTMFSLIKVPMFIPALVGCFLMLNLIDYNGLVNYVLLHLHIISEPLRMRNDPHAISVVALELWKAMPGQIIILYAALQGIRSDIKEAARNLGCKGFGMFKEIIFPLTIVNALVAAILTFIGAFFDFSVSYTAGPIYPISLSYLMRKTAYDEARWGEAACIGVVMILVAVLIVYAYSKLTQLVRKR